MPNEPKSTIDKTFINKVWTVVGIVSLAAITLLLLEATFSVFLLIFAGILIAVFFRGMTGLIQRWSKWNEKLCVGLAILTTLIFAVAFFWLVGSQIQSQATELAETIPKTIETAKAQLSKSTVGQQLLERATSEESSRKLQTFISGFFRSTFGVFGDVYVVLFIGIFITVSPNIYISGMIELIPERGQNKAKLIFKELGKQLRNWLKGKMLSMLAVFILTAIGLAIMGIQLWLVLALMAGMLSFIPNFGPLLALIPAVLVGLLNGPQTALWITGLYIVIQFVESNFITTLIQQKMVNMPPALIISAQLILGALTGSWGLILSTPLTVVIIVLVKNLYIENRTQN